MNLSRLVFMALLWSAAGAHAQLPPLPEVSVTFPDSVRDPLIAMRQPLALRRLALVEEGNAINTACGRILKGSSEHQACLARQQAYNDAVRTLSAELTRLAIDMERISRKHISDSMLKLAVGPDWDDKKRDRLARALAALASDGAPANASQIRSAWDAVLARGLNEELARAAGLGAGPGFPGAGAQMSHGDCAIFALANATGRPYGFVAAKAAEFIGKGEWRNARDRASPQRTIERGLTGEEVILLAETFGLAQVIRSTQFAQVLREGRPVMINVVPPSGNVETGHQVVLTKAFRHRDGTWYEMMDSNQGPLRRLYMSEAELGTVLQETGIAFQPEPKTVAPLLR